jgi:hypothetical protein
MRCALVFASIVALVSACGPGLRTPNPALESQREPFEQTFGPVYPDQPPVGTAVRIDTATLDEARRTLTITFVGSKGYLASDPCSQDYEPWLAPRGGQLYLKVVSVDRVGDAQLGPNEGCTMEGYGHTYHLRLVGPFAGTRVTDLASGQIFEVGNP